MSYYLSRKNKSRKMRFKKNKKLKLVANLWVCYFLLIGFSYLVSDTYSAFNDTESFSETIGAAKDFCEGDDEYTKKYCKDNAGIGNGKDPADGEDSGEKCDPDNPAHGKDCPEGNDQNQGQGPGNNNGGGQDNGNGEGQDKGNGNDGGQGNENGGGQGNENGGGQGNENGGGQDNGNGKGQGNGNNGGQGNGNDKDPDQEQGKDNSAGNTSNISGQNSETETNPIQETDSANTISSVEEQ
ncbi:hypothetical protein [Bacillus sp. NTK034]|uniref:hypothetical protein n=1 Tax=Bacillus sp. NTK034 TaxID=2802176 RepID=UPI001A8D7789|nr:hypothetical protein [Bacillus sp. NTK034]MBN8202416.1 hypothetical protein [Bacillus sp. NTK034]